MTKKLFLALILITQISVLPSWGADTVLIDQITESEAQELDIQIPPETPSGYHQIQIEVYDDAGTISAKTILFMNGQSADRSAAKQRPESKHKPTAGQKSETLVCAARASAL